MKRPIPTNEHCPEQRPDVEARLFDPGPEKQRRRKRPQRRESAHHVIRFALTSTTTYEWDQILHDLFDRPPQTGKISGGGNSKLLPEKTPDGQLRFRADIAKGVPANEYERQRKLRLVGLTRVDDARGRESFEMEQHLPLFRPKSNRDWFHTFYPLRNALDIYHAYPPAYPIDYDELAAGEAQGLMPVVKLPEQDANDRQEIDLFGEALGELVRAKMRSRFRETATPRFHNPRLQNVRVKPNLILDKRIN